MKCSKCGNENEDGAKFCSTCGASLNPKWNCQQCGTENDDNSNYCSNCGKQRYTVITDNDFKDDNSGNHVFEKKSVLMVILLSIITCGIYQIFWYYDTATRLNQVEHKEPELQNYIIAILLGIITCGIYQLYWLYMFYKKVDRYTHEDNCIVNFVVGFFITPLFGLAMVQNSLNNKVAK